ncbi:MAG: presqualene diphosphate synthase HpnD [Alphaproteobacteria bacterium]|nr:presqualene diphosphate synthase HpnD [Alphaproteobacteria bacterium]
MGDCVTLLLVLALAALAAWMGLLMGRHGFWRADQRLPKAPLLLPRKQPQVVAVIPARNEAETIAAALQSILSQDYEALSHVILVDDHSNDGTAEAAQALNDPRLTVISAPDLAKGWAGKLWAMAQGIAKANELAPNAPYLWLTDADIAHGPATLSRLAAKAESDGAVLVSLMARLNCQGFWERLLIPAFVFFFQKLYPFPAVNEVTSNLAAAAGGCMLVRNEALMRAGGLSAIRDQIIDDCALAAILKPKGPIWLGLAEEDESRSLRPYSGLGGIWSMVARTAFVQLRHSWLLLLGTVLAMSLLYLVPLLALVLGILDGQAPLTLAGALGWLCMTIAYSPTIAYYRMKPFLLWAVTLPVAGFFYLLMTLYSALQGGGDWKGRKGGKGIEDPDADRASVEMARDVVEKAGTSFYWAMRSLSSERRDAIFAIYAFCRAVDDIADSTAADETKRNDLAQWRQGIACLYEGRDAPENLPLLRALKAPIRRFALSRKDFEAIIDGMEMDVGTPIRAPSREQFDLYLDRVACAVGRLSNRIMGAPERIADALANSLGRALQTTNILRDLAEDATLGRLYLPLPLLLKYRIQDTDPARVLAHPNLHAACLALAAEAQDLFLQSAGLLGQTDSRPLRPSLAMMTVYRLILNRLIDRGWKDPTQPLAVSKREKLWAALQGALKAGPPTA